MTTEISSLVRDAYASDIPALVAMARRESGEDAGGRELWRSRIGVLIADRTAVVLVATRGDEVRGYLVASVGVPPAMWPGPGPLGWIDMFGVEDPHEWTEVGAQLLEQARERLREAGAVRLVVSTSAHEPAKQAMLWRSGLSLVSEAYQEDLG